MMRARKSKTVGSVVEDASTFLVTVSAVILFVMAATTTADVLGRFILGRSIPGAIGIIEACLALAIAFALPSATWREGHIALGLIRGPQHHIIERLRVGFVSLISAVVVGALAVVLFVDGLEAARYQDVIGYLEIPLAPLVLALSGTTLITCIILVLNIIGVRHKS